MVSNIRGGGVYKGRRMQRGHGLGNLIKYRRGGGAFMDSVMSVGKSAVKKILPVAKEVGKRVLVPMAKKVGKRVLVKVGNVVYSKAQDAIGKKLKGSDNVVKQIAGEAASDALRHLSRPTKRNTKRKLIEDAVAEQLAAPKPKRKRTTQPTAKRNIRRKKRGRGLQTIFD